MSIFKQIKSILNKSDTATISTDTAREAPAERRSKKRLNHKGRRVLIIDDSATIVASLGAMLKSAGCRTSEAPDAETGIEAVQREKPDLVFLDIYTNREANVFPMVAAGKGLSEMIVADDYY